MPTPDPSEKRGGSGKPFSSGWLSTDMTARRRPLPAATFSQLTPLSSRIPPQQSIFMSIIHLGGRSRVIPSEKITEKERDYRSSRPEPRDQGSLPPLSMTRPDSVFRPNFPLFLPFLDSRRGAFSAHWCLLSLRFFAARGVYPWRRTAQRDGYLRRTKEALLFLFIMAAAFSYSSSTSSAFLSRLF